MNVKWYMEEAHACGYVRAEAVARELNAHFRCRVDCKMDLAHSDGPGTDIMIFQRQYKPQVLEAMHYAQSRGVKCIYDIDDDLFRVPKEFGKAGKHYAKAEVQKGMRDFMSSADAVFASTKYLRLAIADKCPETPKYVLRNLLDTERWERAYAERNVTKSKGVTIGWMASGTHIIDLPVITKALGRVLSEYPEVRLHFIGCDVSNKMGKQMKEFKGRIEVDNWVDISVLPMGMKDFDIGLAPLADRPFNLSKSGLKALQYWALGIPVICSPLAAYEFVEAGKDGLHATTPTSWYKAMKELIEDEEKRRLMGAWGRIKVLRDWDMHVHAVDWYGAFEHVLTL